MALAIPLRVFTRLCRRRRRRRCRRCCLFSPSAPRNRHFDRRRRTLPPQWRNLLSLLQLKLKLQLQLQLQLQLPLSVLSPATQNPVISTEGGALCRRSGEICCRFCSCSCSCSCSCRCLFSLPPPKTPSFRPNAAPLPPPSRNLLSLL